MTMPRISGDLDHVAEFAEGILSVSLSSEERVPNLGYTTGLSNEVQKDVRQALASGYRHVILDGSRQSDLDAGRVLAKALRDDSLNRQDVFISLQIDADKDLTPEGVPQQIKQRLRAVGCDYFNMVLLRLPHHQNGFSDNTVGRKRLLSIWRMLVKVMEGRSVRCLGCSNMSRDDMETIFSSEMTKPDMLWLDNSSFATTLQQLDESRLYCKYRGMRLGVQVMLDIRRLEVGVGVKARAQLTAMAKKYKKSPLQLIQRFLLQKGTQVAVSSSPDLERESFQVLDFFLTSGDAEIISTLGT